MAIICLRFLSVCCALTLISCVSPRYVKPEAREGCVFHPAQPPASGTQKWNPIWWVGNADDPVPPDWYRPDQSMRGALWQLRNPLHNFTFYVIGVHDKDFVRRGISPQSVFRPKGGWNWTVIEHGWLRLPFVSYEGKHVRWYALWREKGNFGLKFHRRRKD